MPFLIYGCNNLKSLLDPKTARSCPRCKRYTHMWEDIGDLKSKVDRDWSVTEEGIQIVSQKFRDILQNHSTSDADYVPLSNGTFAFRPRTVVFLDLTGAIRSIHGHCILCGRNTAFLGFPVLGKIMEGQRPVGPLEFARTGMAFGGDLRADEPTIFGDELVAIFKREKLRGSISWCSFPNDGKRFTEIHFMPADVGNT